MDHSAGDSMSHSAGQRISNRVVGAFKDRTGRGPTKSRTTISPELVTVLLGDVLTPMEQRLAAEPGGAETVRHLRWQVQENMRGELVEIVETELHRTVIAFMSANNIDPDLALESFVLEPEPETLAT